MFLDVSPVGRLTDTVFVLAGMFVVVVFLFVCLFLSFFLSLFLGVCFWIFCVFACFVVGFFFFFFLEGGGGGGGGRCNSNSNLSLFQSIHEFLSSF